MLFHLGHFWNAGWGKMDCYGFCHENDWDGTGWSPRYKNYENTLIQAQCSILMRLWLLVILSFLQDTRAANEALPFPKVILQIVGFDRLKKRFGLAGTKSASTKWTIHNDRTFNHHFLGGQNTGRPTLSQTGCCWERVGCQDRKAEDTVVLVPWRTGAQKMVQPSFQRAASQTLGLRKDMSLSSVTWLPLSPECYISWALKIQGRRSAVEYSSWLEDTWLLFMYSNYPVGIHFRLQNYYWKPFNFQWQSLGWTK